MMLMVEMTHYEKMHQKSPIARDSFRESLRILPP